MGFTFGIGELGLFLFELFAARLRAHRGKLMRPFLLYPFELFLENKLGMKFRELEDFGILNENFSYGW